EERKGESWAFGRIITTPCGTPDFWLQLSKGLHLPKCKSTIKVTWEVLLQGTRALNVSSEIYRLTGGTHVAALFNEKGVIYVMTEDVGRHNAVDKAIGKAAILNLDVKKFFLTVSGRISSDLVSKMARVCIPLVASLTSPTSTGVQAAQNLNITLVGFARGTRLNIYTHPDRVLAKGLKEEK
ncbi:MAG: formate dehydrogenase accessory sulfurtransferase FdhD, partial [Candidatus Ranarchaeia archaeon]